MGSTSRASQFSKLHKVLAKHYQPVPVPERPVLEHLLFACCLENAPYPIAEEAFAGLIDIFYDWNEIRVSTIRELAEAMSRLPDPPSAASHLRSVLQDVFEANYTFDLESLKKLNLGPATEAIDKTKGVNSFIASYTVQSALGGHAIPLDSGALGVLQNSRFGNRKAGERKRHSRFGTSHSQKQGSRVRFLASPIERRVHRQSVFDESA